MPDGLRLAIGVPTCRRPEGLRRLLESLMRQEPCPGVRATVLVVDNDAAGTAQAVVAAAEQAGLDVRFALEPEPGIPFARNRLVRLALALGMDALVFVDDDEIAPPGWLAAMVGTWRRTGADMAIGPVEGLLPPSAPGWIAASGFFDKRIGRREGAPVRQAYSYNTLVSRRVLEALGPSFDPAFRHTGGSDRHYFARAREAGFRAVFSAGAGLQETIGPDRACLRWMARRALRYGVSEALCLRLRGAGPLGRLSLVARALARIGFGAAVAATGLAGRPYRRLSQGARFALGGIGCLLGLCGFRIEEYRTVQGEAPAAAAPAPLR